MNITFLIVEDVVNPIIGLDALHHMEFKSISFISSAAWSKSRTSLLKESLVLTRVGHSSVSQRVTSGMEGSSILSSTHNQQVRSLRRLTLRSTQNHVWAFQQKKKILHFEKLNQQQLPAPWHRAPESAKAAEKEAHSSTQARVRSWCSLCQRAQGQQHHHKSKSQKIQSVIQLDQSFYEIPGEREKLKVFTFVETITSMSGAVVVPDHSASHVEVRALKQFIAVNGFTKSVLQCDGHAGLLNLQEQVARDLSLPTQISPQYSHQSQGSVERFRKTL